MKLAIHTQTYVNRQGNPNPGWRSWFIFRGTNPVGPRGGRCGNVLNGRCVAGPFRSLVAAEAHIKASPDLQLIELI
jgi:hypothetical protein